MTNPNTAPSADSDGGANKQDRQLVNQGRDEGMRAAFLAMQEAQTGGAEAVAPEARADVLKQLRTAMDVVSALCDGSMRWTMSVPARPDSDPDLVISGALHAAEKLIAAAPPAPPAPLPGKESAFLSAVATIYIDPHDERQELEYIGHIPRGELIRLYKAPNAVHADLLNVAIAVRDACHKAWVTSAENWRADVDVKSIVSAAPSVDSDGGAELPQVDANNSGLAMKLADGREVRARLSVDGGSVCFDLTATNAAHTKIALSFEAIESMRLLANRLAAAQECGEAVAPEAKPEWPKGAFFTDGEGSFYDEQAEPLDHAFTPPAPPAPLPGKESRHMDDSELYCPQCNGSGEGRERTTGHGPDDYEYDCPCQLCGGNGSLFRAFEGMKAERDALRQKYNAALARFPVPSLLPAEVEQRTYKDGTQATGIAPLPNKSPAEQERAALSAQAAPEYRTGFDEAPSTFNQEDAAPADYPPPQKYDDVLVPFVAAMRKELHANSGKGDRPGWLAMDANTALLEVYWHAAKLSAAVKNNDGPAIQEHSADVANMAMMVLDICGGLAWVEVAADRAQRSGVSADPLPQPRHDDGSPAPEDFIAKSKRILAAVDLYHEAPNSTNRTNLRMVIWHQLESAAQPQPLVEPTAAFEAHQKNGLAWAVSQWNACVKNRPLVNVHRRSFDDTWRQVIRYFGGDPDKLVGPSHDALLTQGGE